MKIEPLFEAIANFAVFLETASNDVLDPDEAVTQQEELSLSLRNADIEVKTSFASYSKKIAAQQTDPIRRQAFQNLPYELGLVDMDKE